MSHIGIRKLSYQPASAPERILSEVTHDFAEGHMTALLGPNGSGKTTLLKHILAQIKSPSGAVLIDGKDAYAYSPKALGSILAWVPQSHSGESAFSVEDMVAMARYPYKSTWEADNEDDEKIITDAMRKVGISHLRKREFYSLSGGEKQRALIARALSQTTPWILLDEPTSNLDIKHQIQIMKLLSELVREGNGSVIVVMHDFNMVSRYCDRAVLLKNGKVLASGKTEEVLKPEIMKEAYEVDFEVMEKNGHKMYIARDAISE